MNPKQTAHCNAARAGQEHDRQSALTLNRRELLKLVGGGILICLWPREVFGVTYRLPSEYVLIGEDGTVTIFTGKVEFGQGVMTSLAQMAAEELDVPLSAMRVVMGDTRLCPVDRDGGTFGSLTTRSFGPALRTGAAQARALLVQLGSEHLGVPVADLATRDGYVFKREDETVRVSYAALAGGKSVVVDVPRAATVEAPSQFTISGKPALRLDAVEKVTGRAKYTADIQLPGMLYARLLRPPARGATLVSADTSAAEQMAGVRVIRTGNIVAVLHEKPDLAERALRLVKAEFTQTQPGPDDESIYDYILTRPGSARTVGTAGNLVSGEHQAVQMLERSYRTPYVAHAPLEPHAATASLENAALTVWASTQTPFPARTEAGAARLITPYIGGGFGGKIDNPQVREAAQIARAAGVPVSVAWTREEEFFDDKFQCPSVIDVRAGVNSSGRITFWDYRVRWVGDRGAGVLYSIPNYRIQAFGNYDQARPFAGGAWRAPGANANTFARESHIDSLAALAGIDPVQFRLNHLQHSGGARLRKTIEAAAAQFGWTPAKGPSGRGYGIACGEDAGTFVAMMAEVAVNQATGDVKVIRMLCAHDMGRVINPEGARAQMEGGMMMGLGYALSEELHFNTGGRILDRTFATYEIPGFSRMPKLETVLVDNNNTNPAGGGEPPIITVGAVVANAIFDATGARLSRLPMTPDRVRAEIQSAPLSIQGPERVGNEIRLSWKGAPGVRLQKTTALKDPVWEDVPGSDGASGVTLPATDAAAFFRLRKP